MHTLSGGCHCGNILMELELSDEPGSFSPRACDCSFCLQRAAAYISDPHGVLHIQVKDEKLKGHYRQGSGQAEFLFCRGCGVLVGALYQNGNQCFAAVNAHAVQGGKPFAPEQPASSQSLSPAERVQRWLALWFPNVRIKTVTVPESE